MIWSARVLLAVAVSLLASVCTAQVEWSRVGGIEARSNHGMAFDSARGRTVVFGGALDTSTWEWDGARWERRSSLHSPPVILHAELAFDSARSVSVLFGSDPSGRSETWEWDGVDWTRRNPRTVPPGVDGHAMVYDSVRGRTVLFGGIDRSSTLRDDTWEWDGNDWQRRSPNNCPSSRYVHAMAYDRVRRRVVLFGGGTGSLLALGAETWEWDGNDWLQRSPANDPGNLGRHAMVYDQGRQRVVLFGGTSDNLSAVSDQVWEWDGANWVRRSTSTRPVGRVQHAMVYDSARAEVVLFSGDRLRPFTGLGDTWTHDGIAWRQLQVTSRPAADFGVSAAYDVARRRVVLFNGQSSGLSTWEWDGSIWRDRPSANRPPRLSGPVLAHDALRQRTVLFGGVDAATGLESDLTWEWDGIDWSVRSPVTRPRGRSRPGMAYDLHRDRVVLFGGARGGAARSDTWEWDGQSWVQRFPTVVPSPRQGPAMVADLGRGRIVMFGGTDSAGAPLNDTWEWDGQSWVQRSPASGPAPRNTLAMVYDAARQRTVLFAAPYATALAETWEWDGTDWRLRSTSTTPPNGYTSFAMAWDAARSQVVWHGGLWVSGATVQTWILQPTTPATYASFGTGCVGSAGVPRLRAGVLQLPWTDGRFAVELSDLPASGLALLALGLSDAWWGTLRLPYDLGPAGMPGCAALVSVDEFVVLPVVSGRARWEYTIGSAASLVGRTFYSQALVLDPAANAFGATVSNAASGRIGGR